ncbi:MULTISPECIES: hypothetical protein [Streptomyces]|uniref:ATP-binding protein n=1 Tax=Streptomyces qinglanensis TaxID=943816 RepID=A0A1E7K9L8_9ACTN|nr:MULTISPECIES: hypothetical protein [Streptomyces]MBE9497977.1 hypothetical protein [Streptomyces sp. GKU 257-1]OEV00625.1 hypothetical protein AN217_25685 [Streptomyces qinglanensis]OEV25770.1 hypothetical protein AN220_11845 [Streptomyces nanshensis]OEV25773.1 hypothetical protein AN220_11860 [Streptomyces nanshensis]
MKQVAKKTLGVAAMSAAVVVAGAGAASALPVEGLGAPTDVVGTDAVGAGGRALGPLAETAGQTLGSLPLEEATQGLPGGLSQPVGVAQEALSGALTGTPLDATEKVAGQAQKSVEGKSSAPGGGMIGGLPLGSALPVGGSH